MDEIPILPELDLNDKQYILNSLTVISIFYFKIRYDTLQQNYIITTNITSLI